MSTTNGTPDTRVASIRSKIAALEGELAAIEGKPLRLYDGHYGQVHDTPQGGAILHVQWAISDQSYEDWYPTTEAAKAALLRLARDCGTAPDATGFHVDLTAPGCHQSSAWVERHSTQLSEQEREGLR